MRTLIFTCVCLLGQALLAKDAITCEAFPDADSVLVNEIERITYHPDGTYEQTDESWSKILTEKGRREESVVVLAYSKRYGTAAIDYVGAIAEDGTEREINVADTTKEATDNGSMAANIYDPLDRKITCTVPGLKIGETLHVRTRRSTTHPRCKDQWADLSVMEWTCPIMRSTYEVTAPKERPLKKIAIRHPLGNIAESRRTLADGSTVHTFTVTNSAQVFPEPDMPPLHTQVQNVRVSTADSWYEISKWYWNLCAPHIAKTNAAMVAKVAELARAAKTREDKIRAIFKFVSQEVRYMGLTMEDTSPGYAPHDVDITFDNRYGVCRDKAGLLVAMLRLAGLDAYPVLIHVGAKMDRDVPQPFFNHAIVSIAEGRDYVLMDPTNENAKDLFPSYLCDKSYIVCRPEGEDLRVSPVPEPVKNSVDVVSKGTLSKDGAIVLESDISLSGINDTAYRHAFARKKPEDRVKFFERLMQGLVPGAELVTCEIEPKDMRDTDAELRVSLSVRLPEMTLSGETRSELNVPFVTRGMGVANFLLMGSTALVERKYPLSLDTTARVSETLTLNLDGVLGGVRELPPDEECESAGYRYTRHFGVTNDTLTAKREMTISAVEFDPKAYGDLREEIKWVEAAERKRPVFSNDGLRDADVRYFLDSSETTVFSDKEWVTTNTTVKEILTYDGKKRSAELRLGFHPSWKNVEVVTAVVSNRDGRVSQVTEKEKNVMDCAWASAAPRYPAGKMLIVNLPSVEIGSVITVQTVTTVTNAPCSFYASFEFDSHEPLDRRIVRVNGWKRDVRRPRRLPNEPNQPSACYWRDQVIVSSNRFERFSLKIPSTIDSPIKGKPSIREIRDWMAKYVKVVGPGLYELPLAEQLTDPATVLKERYATRLDYVRTLCALMRTAGYDADVVLASSDQNDPDSVRHRIMVDKPNVRAFSAALCRVTEGAGGFLGLFGKKRTYFIGTENQYAELGASSYESADYYDPESGKFGIVTVPNILHLSFAGEKTVYDIRENGAVDLTVENVICGPTVAAFRKRYSELLPEDRSRRYQEILGGVSQAATATSELVTDVESYPAVRTFSCYIPDYATIADDALTIQIPPFVSNLPTLTGKVRQTPFALSSSLPENEDVTIRFPAGYTAVEHVPEPFAFSDPLDPDSVWLTSEVSSGIEDGRLVVHLVRNVMRRPNVWYGSFLYELLKEWNRIASARANRTVVVRKR